MSVKWYLNKLLIPFLKNFFFFPLELLFSQKHLWVFGCETKQYEAQSISG